VRVGSKRLFYLSSIGHAILAFMPTRDQSRILNNLYSTRHPDGNLPGKNQFMEQLKDIKRLGYSVLKPKMFRDIQSLATPILNHQGIPIAGINIVIPRIIPAAQIDQEFVPKLIEAGKNISLALGHQEARIG
jgi:DNA-binding IclR family transcriptional regulator